MKKHIIITGSFLCLLSLNSCKKFLEQVPDQRTELNSSEKIAELLVTAYPEANYMTFCESMSDNVTENLNASTVEPTNTDPFFWRDVTETNQDAPTYYWNGCYEAIAAANQALQAIDLAGNGVADNYLRGEALLCRAYAHFMLVTLFSKVYDPATAAADPGIPYVLEPEVVVFGNYERKTVAYVYEQIEKDLTEGLPMIDDASYTVPRFHFTRTAAHAFATRFYLFKKDWDKVVEHAKMAFPNDNYVKNMRPWLTTYANYTSSELGLNYVKSTENANLLLCETVSWWARRFTAHRYATSENLVNRILAKGYGHVAGGTLAYRTWYSTSSRNYYIRKLSEHFVRVSINATTGRGYDVIPLFTTEEVLLNLSEAYTEMGDFTNALKYLNMFLSARISNYNASSNTVTEESAKSYFGMEDSRDAIIEALLFYRRAEFLHEGMRWFDILRHKRTVVHTTEDLQTYTLEPNDPRRVLQIPEEASSIGLNPR